MSAASLRLLEFDKVVALLAGFSVTGPGRELLLALRPLGAREAVAASLNACSEMQRHLEQAGVPSLGGACDLGEHLRQVRAEGSWLPPAALLEVRTSLEAAAGCRRAFAAADHAPGLQELSRGLAECRGLLRELQQSIGARGEILDGASFELGELRREILQLRARIRRTLENILARDSLAGAFQDRLVTERGGRYVVPVRADHRGQVKGFIHDESASGQTLYVEPTAVLEANNDLQTALREEKREEERVLRRLAAAVRAVAAELAANQAILARLDAYAAIARFARQAGACAPQLSAEPRLELYAARHPLLLFAADGSPRASAAVPVDVLLGPEREALVISGPNTGGKTVALKTAGLLQLMVAAGLPIPCREQSRVHVFAQVFADIGDEQSIEAALSTFSGHLVRVREILAAADADSLVLLDEAGTGTDPAEGGALALAVLDELRQRGARVILTTHLNLIKGYAHLQDRVENAAVEFDPETLAPTYRLHYGIPGASSAFTIAARLGLPEAVLARAEAYLGSDEREGLDLIERLNALTRELAGRPRGGPAPEEPGRQRAGEAQTSARRTGGGAPPYSGAGDAARRDPGAQGGRPPARTAGCRRGCRRRAAASTGGTGRAAQGGARRDRGRAAGGAAPRPLCPARSRPANWCGSSPWAPRPRCCAVPAAASSSLPAARSCACPSMPWRPSARAALPRAQPRRGCAAASSATVSSRDCCWSASASTRRWPCWRDFSTMPCSMASARSRWCTAAARGSCAGRCANGSLPIARSRRFTPRHRSRGERT